MDDPNSMKHLISGLLLALFFLPSAVFAAGSATMSIEESTYSALRGEQFTVNVLVDPNGESLDTVRAVVTFDPNVLRAQSVDLIGSFDRSAPGNYIDNGSGKVSWGAFTIGGPVTTSTNLIGITFLALEEGTASVSVSSDSRAIDNGEERIDVGELGAATATVSSSQEAEPGTALVILSSDSHSNDVDWYAESTVDFAWTVLEGDSPIGAYYYHFGKEVGGELETQLDGDSKDLTVEAVGDGTFYLSLKGVHEDGRETNVVTRAVHIDTTNPNPIELTAQDNRVLEGESVWLTFATTDETSGIAQYQIAINESDFQVQSSPLRFDDLEPGTYFFRVIALDKAENSVFGSASVRVYPEGTELERPEGHEENQEIDAVLEALTKASDGVTDGGFPVKGVAAGLIILLALVYISRKRKN
jgi:hypothetical protein